jgi:hypothetical protein
MLSFARTLSNRLLGVHRASGVGFLFSKMAALGIISQALIACGIPSTPSASNQNTTPVDNSPVAGLTYTNTYFTMTKRVPMVPAEPKLQHGKPKLFSVSPAIPKGISFDSVTGTFTGTSASKVALTHYIVTASNTFGFSRYDFDLEVLTTDPGKSTVATSKTSVVADGKDTTTVTLTALDRNGIAITNELVKLSSNRFTDTISPSTVKTDDQGVAKFTVSSTVSGTPTFFASDEEDQVVILQTANLNFTPGPVDKLLWVSPPSNSVAGQAITLSVRALDANNNITTLVPGSASLTETGPVSINLPSPVALTSGEGSFASFSPTVSGSYTFQATTGNVKTTNLAISVSPSAPVKLTYSDQPSSTGTAGTFLSQSPSVQVRDQYNNPVTNSAVSVSLAPYSDSNCQTLVTPLNGIPTFDIAKNPLSTSAGVAGFSSLRIYKTSIVSLGASGTDALGNRLTSACSTPITIIPGTASSTHSKITGTSSILADGIKTSAITVSLFDNYQNPVPGKTPVFSATDTGNTNTYGNCSATDSTGNANCTLSSLRAEKKTLYLTNPSVIGTPIEFIAGAAKRFELNPSWINNRVGTELILSARALDNLGNLATSYSGSVNLTAPSDPLAQLPINLKMSAGLITIPAIFLKTAGALSLILTDATDASILGSSSLTLNPGPVSFTKSSITTNADLLSVGDSITATFTAKDDFGNSAPTGISAPSDLIWGYTPHSLEFGRFDITQDLGKGVYQVHLTGVKPGSTSLTLAMSGNTFSNTHTITVIDIPPRLLTYSPSTLTLTKGSAMSAAVPSSTGGAVVSYTSSPLPAGLTLDSMTGVISGTPTTLQVAAPYTITANNSGGSSSATLSITVNDVAPNSLSYSNSLPVYTIGTTIPNNTPTVYGGAITAYTVSPALPSGLNLNFLTGVISGTPNSITPTTNYTITALNSGGSTTKVLPIAVNDIAPTHLSYSNNSPIYTLGTTISNNFPTNDGGLIIHYSVTPTLPNGINLDSITGMISGKPSVLAVNTTYTITASNSGGSVSKSISLTVNDVAPSGLSYSPTSLTATRNSAITSLNPTSSGGGVTNYTASSLPQGLSINPLSGVITGTPTSISGATSYNITASNSGGSTTASVNITVNDISPSSLSYTNASATYTVGTLINSNVPTSDGGPVVSYAITPALPSGLAFNSNTGVISGTPTLVSSNTTYTVTATNSGGSSTKAISITVNDVIPSNLSYNPAVIVATKGSSITAMNPTSSGGSITQYSAPALPNGLSINSSTGVISGTPTNLQVATPYLITASNSGGATTATINITVNDLAPSSLSYNVASAVYTVGNSIIANSPTAGGGPITHYSVNPSLPSGLLLDGTTGVISGTPTLISPNTHYTVTASNSGGAITKTINITINDVAPNTLSYNPSTLTFTKGSAITNLNPTASGGSITHYSATLLPDGLSINPSTGVISGTPTIVSNPNSYTIVGTNSGGSTNTTLSLTMNDISPSTLTYSDLNSAYTLGTNINPNSPSSSGGTVISYTITPSLPAGLAINSANGIISGTPTALSANATYTVTATNSGGTTSKTLTIAVNDVAPSNLNYTSSTVTYTRGASISNNSPSSTGGAIVSYSVNPALPNGLNISTTSGVISGTPSVLSPSTNYTITATNSGGSTTKAISITVNDVAPSSLTYSPALFSATKGTAITAMSPSASGGAITSYSATSLPSGLSLNTSTGVISGTPTAIQVATPYTITATNSGGSMTASINITVNDVAPSSLSYSPSNLTVTKGSSITAMNPNALGGVITSYSASNLPSGLSINSVTGVISGSPSSILSATNSTVTAQNSGGSTTATITFTVNDIAPNSLNYTNTSATYTLGASIASNTPTSNGGTVVSYSISPTLPTGLSFNTSTGVVSGTPSSLSPITAYTVTATNSGGSTSKMINITVNDSIPTSLTYSPSTLTATKGNVITAMNPSSVGGSVTSYSAPSLPAGLSINSTTGVISGNPTFTQVATPYTITASNSGGSITTTINITVNDIAPHSLSYTSASSVYTLGSTISNNVPSSSGGQINLYSITPTLPSGLIFNSSTGTISGTPASISPTTTYTVTATNSGGSTPVAITITVNDVIPSALTYSPATLSATRGSAITAMNPTSAGGNITHFSASILPSGLSIDPTTGVISGTPSTIQVATPYVITASNSGGSTTATISITINDIAPSGLSYSPSTITATRATAIVAMNPNSMGGTVTNYSAANLPEGIIINASSGAITGTPTNVTPTRAYTITATNSGGTTHFTITITVNDIPPNNLAYSVQSITATTGIAIINQTPTASGGPITSYSINPHLPSGIQLDPTTGMLSGIPNEISNLSTYIISASNTGGSVSTRIDLSVAEPAASPMPEASLTDRLVEINFKADPRLNCAGFVIKPNDSLAIITSAHCFEKYDPREALIIIGGRTLAKLRGYFIHESYKPETRDNDLALLQIDPIELNIPNYEYDFPMPKDNFSTYAYGWNPEGNLRITDATVLSPEQLDPKALPYYIPETMHLVDSHQFGCQFNQYALFYIDEKKTTHLVGFKNNNSDACTSQDSVVSLFPNYLEWIKANSP